MNNEEKLISIIEEAIYNSKRYLKDGEVASYIPELANVDADNFSMALVTVNGNIYSFGDEDIVFSMQSISKVISLILALHDQGSEIVYSKIGTEPTKYKFNSLIPIEDTAANPLINAGAMTTASLIKGENLEEKFKRVVDVVSVLSNSRDIKFLEKVYNSEMQTTDVNRSIAYYLRSKNIFDDDAEKVLDLYVRNCSIGVNTRQLAHIGAVLANGGCSLEDGKRIISEESVKITLSQMASCGMYEESGEFLIKVGFPAKSGVSGAILGIVPGKCGICTYSPRLDKSGNSIRGKKVLEELSETLKLNIFYKEELWKI